MIMINQLHHRSPYVGAALVGVPLTNLIHYITLPDRAQRSHNVDVAHLFVCFTP